MQTRDDDTRAFVRSVFQATTPPVSSDLRRRVVAARESGRKASAPWWRTRRQEAGFSVAALAAAVILALLFVTLVLPRLYPATSPGGLPSSVPTIGPKAASLAEQVFQAFGDPAPRSPGVLAQATSSGYTVRVVNAFDDGNLFLLDFQVVRAGTSAGPIADAFPDGRYDPAIHGGTLTVRCNGVTVPPGVIMPSELGPRGLTTNQQDALQSVVMARVAGTRSGAPDSISVEIREIEFGGPNLPGQGPAGQGWKGFRLVSGTWRFSLSVPVTGSTRSITPPSPLTVGSAGITFTSAIVGGDSYLELVNSCATSNCGGQTLYGPDGQPLALIGGGSAGVAGNGRPLLANFYELAARAGTYTTLFAPGAGQPTTQATFTVPVANPNPVSIPPSGVIGPRSIPPPTNVPATAPASPTPTATPSSTPSASPSSASSPRPTS
ncbi:MAG: hypothetical protein ACREQM_16025 [Candidatus Dormibacteraceae bacterium]